MGIFSREQRGRFVPRGSSDPMDPGFLIRGIQLEDGHRKKGKIIQAVILRLPSGELTFCNGKWL